MLTSIFTGDNKTACVKELVLVGTAGWLGYTWKQSNLSIGLGPAAKPTGNACHQ